MDGSMRWCAALAAMGLMVACGDDDPSAEPSTVGGPVTGPGDSVGDTDLPTTGVVDEGSGTTDGPSAECPGGDAAWTAVTGRVQAYVDAQGGPGAALAVVCDGQLVHATGFGSTRFAGGDPVTETTRFQLASVSKMFTGAAAVALAEEGVVDLKAPVGDVLAGVDYGRITLHQLLTHTAGYPTEFDVLQSADLVTVVLDNGAQPLWVPPGAVWNYSNPGYSVAGAVLEVASGTAFGELVETELFAPAGMKRATMFVPTVLAEGDYAYGHEGSAGSPVAIAPDGSYFGSGTYGPQGGAWGSVEDLARWGVVHLEGGADVMSAAGMASLGEFHTRTADSEQGYGYGLFVETYYDPDVLTHGGGAPGFLAEWRLVPDLDFGVFAVTNAEWLSPNEITGIAMEEYVELGWDGAPPVEPSLGDHVGTYVDPYGLLGTIEVVRDGQGLSAQIDGSSEPMMHLWEDVFLVFHPGVGSEIDLSFWRAEGPQSKHVVSTWGVGTRV